MAAPTVTSYTPTTGPASGGTQCVVTGTNLAPVDVVLVGGKTAAIVGTPTGTSLTFRTPAGTAGTAKVVLVNSGTGEDVVAGTDFTYTAVPATETLVSTLAGKFALRVRNIGDSNFTKVRGVLSLKPGRNYSTEDDSDMDTGLDGSDFITQRKNEFTGTVKRGKGVTSHAYDPGQEIIRLAEEAGLAIEGQVYDRTGGPEAWQFTALVQWAPQGGNKTSDKVDFTLGIQGSRTVITNPVIADNTLATPYTIG